VNGVRLGPGAAQPLQDGTVFSSSRGQKAVRKMQSKRKVAGGDKAEGVGRSHPAYDDPGVARWMGLRSIPR